MQNTNGISIAATGKVTLKEIVGKLFVKKQSDTDSCPKDALMVKEFGGYKKTRMYLCKESNPQCGYFKRTKEKPTPVYMGLEKNSYTLCPNH